MKVELTKCDGCSKVLERKQDIYRIYLTTDRFWDGAEMDTLTERLEFCRACALDIKTVLVDIANEMTKGYNNA